MTPCEEAIWNIYLRTYTYMHSNKDNLIFGKYKDGIKRDLIGNIVMEGVDYKPKYEQVPVDILLARYPELRNNLIHLNFCPNEENSQDWGEVDNFLVQLQCWYDTVVRKYGWNDKTEEHLQKIYLPIVEKLKPQPAK